MHELRRTAWDLKAAWIRCCEPELPESEVQERMRQIFLREGGGSYKHAADVGSMLRVLGDAVDRGMIEREVDRLGLRTVWSKVSM